MLSNICIKFDKLDVCGEYEVNRKALAGAALVLIIRDKIKVRLTCNS